MYYMGCEPINSESVKVIGQFEREFDCFFCQRKKKKKKKRVCIHQLLTRNDNNAMRSIRWSKEISFQDLYQRLMILIKTSYYKNNNILIITIWKNL